MRPFKMAILASGGGSNLQSIIEAVEAKKLKSTIACVISNKEDAYALERARNHQIKAIYIGPDNYDQRLLQTLQEEKVDLIVLAGYLKIVKPEIIDAYKGQIINIHPSLLPKYGGHGYYGIHVHKAVVKAREQESGATVHYVDQGIDTGEIILQRRVPVFETDTPQTLQKRILEEVEHQLFVEAIAKLEQENIG